MRVTILGSGSEGNATLVEAGSKKLVIDAGLSLRQLRKRALSILGISLDAVDALLITHAHSDHGAHAAMYAKHLDCRVHTTAVTHKRLKLSDDTATMIHDPQSQFKIGSLIVHTLPVPHDAPQVALRLTHREGNLGLVTDLGRVPDNLPAFLMTCNTLLLEANHDEDLLRYGNYPEVLKRRVGGPMGHLSNAQMASLLKRLPNVQRVVLMHLSKNNNRPAMALNRAKKALGPRATVEIAPRDGGLIIETNATRQLSLSL